MDFNDKKVFGKLLTDSLAAYGKNLPDAGPMLSAWWDALNMFPLQVVAMAFSVYRDQNGEFAPVPAGIAKLCKSMDGRPSVDEAWAIAITGRSEEETVVWTAETAEAFGICQPILNDLGDEVGARMAFKDAYSRLVTAARSAGKPATWNVSLGWDKRKREAALERAVVAGILPAPAVTALLPPPEVDLAKCDPNARQQIDKIKEMLARMNEEKRIEREQHAQRERDETAAAKQRANELAANYRQDDAA